MSAGDVPLWPLQGSASFRNGPRPKFLACRLCLSPEEADTYQTRCPCLGAAVLPLSKEVLRRALLTPVPLPAIPPPGPELHPSRTFHVVPGSLRSLSPICASPRMPLSLCRSSSTSPSHEGLLSPLRGAQPSASSLHICFYFSTILFLTLHGGRTPGMSGAGIRPRAWHSPGIIIHGFPRLWG